MSKPQCPLPPPYTLPAERTNIKHNFDTIDRKWEYFLKIRHEDDILGIAEAYPDKCSLAVCHLDIDKADVELGDFIIDDPDKALEAGRIVLARMINDYAISDIDISPDGIFLEIQDTRRTARLRDIRCQHIDQIVEVNGLVRSVTEIRPKITAAAFRCKRCGTTFKKPITGLKGIKNIICPNQVCERGGPYEYIKRESKYVNSQKITLQEFPEDMRPGEQPYAIKLELLGCLPGRAVPGERITIAGIYRTIENLEKGPFCETYMDGISLSSRDTGYGQIEITEEDKTRIKEIADDPELHSRLASSIAPAIYSLVEVKEALVLQLVSTPPRMLPGGTRRRGDIHILLVGDPGLAKSQLLRYVRSISPRGVFASGKAATSAGLTYAAVKDADSGQWVLEAGALPMADGGIVCVDELDKMRDEDRSALHEAMEAQTISVAKAGILATLKCGCSVLAAANPKLGRFDQYEPIAAQINLAPTLLTRFDLIFIISDTVDERRDAAIADCILNSGKVAEADYLEPSFLQKYIAYCRMLPAPVLDEGADKVLRAAYLAIRLGSSKCKDSKPIPITPRYLEGMIRLTEASARLRLSSIAEKQDAQRAVNIMINCLKKVGVDPETGEWDIGTIELGNTKRYADRTKAVMKAIRDLSKHHFTGVPLEEIIKESGIEADKVSEIIDRLRRDGDICLRGQDKYCIMEA